jgi:hypothetical protein
MLARAAFLLCLALACASPMVLAQPAPRDGPPVPFEDAGACPFELCTYGDWTARRAVVVRQERRLGSPIVFRVARGEKVTAITGVVVTLEAGRVRFRVRHEMDSRTGRLVVMPGQILYLLTYQGEGFTKAWFGGRLYDELDGTEFFNAACEDDPGRCAGRIVVQPRREWWAQLRNAAGQVGWTNEAETFSQPRVG